MALDVPSIQLTKKNGACVREIFSGGWREGVDRGGRPGGVKRDDTEVG